MIAGDAAALPLSVVRKRVQPFPLTPDPISHPMPYLTRLLAIAFLLPWAALASGEPRQLDWAELLPPSDRDGYDPTPPPPIHDYLSGEASMPALQPMSYTVNDELNGQDVRIPGFVVPLELDEQGRVTEFFLVPYFGACIHVPPPPPNQIVFVVIEGGLSLDSMYAAYWVTGTMSTQARDTRLGKSAYTLAAEAVEEYEF